MRQEKYKQAMETMVFYNFDSAFQEGCSRCTLSNHGCSPILYRGNPEAPILLIGEAPGKVEEELKKPFVGPAGELLDKMMSAIGLSTEHDMIIMNTVFCRPTASKFSNKQNYTPRQEQIVRCWPFVEKAIQILKPSIIIACGRTALCKLIDDNTARIGQHEGLWRFHKSSSTPVFVMTHPAAILHKAPWPDEQAAMKRKVWDYMQKFRDTWKIKGRIE